MIGSNVGYGPVPPRIPWVEEAFEVDSLAEMARMFDLLAYKRSSSSSI